MAARAPEKLSRRARRICESLAKPLLVSVVSLWELIAKCEAGALEIPAVGSTLSTWLERNARALPLEAAHVLTLYGSPCCITKRLTGYSWRKRGPRG